LGSVRGAIQLSPFVIGQARQNPGPSAAASCDLETDHTNPPEWRTRSFKRCNALSDFGSNQSLRDQIPRCGQIVYEAVMKAG